MTPRPDDAEDERLLAEGEIALVFARHYSSLIARARTRLDDEAAEGIVRECVTKVHREWLGLGELGRPIRAILHARLGALLASCTLSQSGESRSSLDGETVTEGAVTSTEQFQRFLELLTAEQTQIAQAIFFEGSSVDAVASRLGRPRAEVRQELLRIYERLRESILG